MYNMRLKFHNKNSFHHHHRDSNLEYALRANMFRLIIYCV